MELVINIATKVILYFVIAGIVKAVINKFFENDDFVVLKDYKSIEINRKFFAKVYSLFNNDWIYYSYIYSFTL